MFHLAPAVSGECEADFDLGLRSNIDSTRAPLDALRFNVNLTKAAGGKPPRLVCSSSVAVFGPDPAVPLPKAVADDTLPAPQTSDGTHKLIGRHLVADCPRKRYIDGRAARLMTVTVRPCKQNGAASSFFSGIIREPLAGVESICPVDANVSLPVSSPTRPVEGLIAVFEASREAFNGRTAMNQPALNVRWSDMLDALARVARVAGWPGGRVAGCERMRFERDERIAGIVANWPGGAEAAHTSRLGLAAHANFAEIIRQCIDDGASAPNADQSLKGMSR